MSLAAFRKSLDDLHDRVAVSGKYALDERLAIALPDGDVAAIDDPTFVDWLVEHSEPAPFGQGGQTKLDPDVRDALRLRARGEATVHGFDPAAILDEIEAALSPHEHLAAKLTDVVTYREDGHFDRHKDTPHDAALVATLVVGLPIEHSGGALDVGDDDSFEWGTPTPGELPWVALFSDVDHAISRVRSGTRITLVYELSRSGRPRHDAAHAARIAALAGAARSLELPAAGPLMIACSRLIATADATQPQAIRVLRGMDRAIAEALITAGFAVVVRSCVAAASDQDDRERAVFESYDPIARLAKAIPPDVIVEGDAVTFSDSASADDVEEYPATNLGPYIVDQIPVDRWVIGEQAAMTLIGNEMFDADGYFGNQGHYKYIYTLAALEVTKA